MGKSGQAILIIGVLLILLSFVITPLQSAICRGSVQSEFMKGFTGVLCGFMGIASSFVLISVGIVMLILGVIISILPW